MRVLIVDDNRKMRRFLRSLLIDLHPELCEASDGEEAVALFSTFHPDVVLMDVRMPVMDGIDATRRIVRGNPSAEVIIVTDFDLP
jgi:CheY-like chemotaxis protein